MSKNKRELFAQADPDDRQELYDNLIAEHEEEAYQNALESQNKKTHFVRREATPEEQASHRQRPYIRLRWGQNPLNPEETVVVGFDMPVALAHPMVPKNRRSLDPNEIVSVEMPTSPAASRHWLESFADIPPGTEVIYNLPPLLGSRSSSQQGGTWWAKITKGLMDPEGSEHKIMHPALLPEGYTRIPNWEEELQFEEEDLSPLSLENEKDLRMRELLQEENDRRERRIRTKKSKTGSTWGDSNRRHLKIFNKWLRDIVGKLNRGEDIGDISVFDIPSYTSEGKSKKYQAKTHGSRMNDFYSLYHWVEDIAFYEAKGITGSAHEAEVLIEEMDLNAAIAEAFQKILSAYRDPSLNQPLSIYFMDSIERSVDKTFSRRGKEREKFRSYEEVGGVGKEGDRRSGEESVEGGTSLTIDQEEDLSPDELVIRQDPEVKAADDALRAGLAMSKIPMEDLIKRGENMRSAMITRMQRIEPELIPALDTKFKRWVFSGGYRLPEILLERPSLLDHFSFGNVPFVSKRQCPECYQMSLPESRDFILDEFQRAELEEARERAAEEGRELSAEETYAITGRRDPDFYKCENCKAEIGRVRLDQIQSSINLTALMFLEVEADEKRAAGQRDTASLIAGLGLGVPVLMGQVGTPRANETQRAEIAKTQLLKLRAKHPDLNDAQLQSIQSDPDKPNSKSLLDKAIDDEIAKLAKKNKTKSGKMAKSHGRRFLLIKGGNGLLPRVMGAKKKESRSEVGLFGHAGIPTMFWGNAIKMGDVMGGFVSPVSEHEGTVGYGPGSITTVPYPGLVTNPQDIRGHMIEQMTPKFFKETETSPDFADVDVATSPSRDPSGYAERLEAAMNEAHQAGEQDTVEELKGIAETELGLEPIFDEENGIWNINFDLRGENRTRMQNNIIKQRLLANEAMGRDIVVAAMSLAGDIGDRVLSSMGLDPEQTGMGERLRLLDQEIKNWAYRVLQRAGLEDQFSEQVGELISQIMSMLGNISGEEETSLGPPKAYEEDENARNSAVVWLFWQIDGAGGFGRNKDEVLDEIYPLAAQAVPIENYATAIGQLAENAELPPEPPDWFRQLFDEAWTQIEGQTYKLRRLRHVMQEAGGREGRLFAVKDEAKFDVAEKISTILTSMVVSRPENIIWEAAPDKVKEGIAEPDLEINYPPIIDEEGNLSIDPDTGYLARDFGQAPQLVQKYEMKTPKKKKPILDEQGQPVLDEKGKPVTIKDISVKGGMFGTQNAIEKIVEMKAGTKMEKFMFLRDIFWLASGAFGFGGDWTSGGTVKAPIRQEPRADITRGVDQPHSTMFTPEQIAKRYGVSEDLVERMLQDSVTFVRTFYRSNAGASEAAKLAADILTLTFFIPNEILTSFANAAAQNEDIITERSKQSPILRAAEMIGQLGTIVNEVVAEIGGKPDADNKEQMRHYIRRVADNEKAIKLRRKYSDEIDSNENFIGMIKDLLTSGPTKRAFESIDLNLVASMMHKLTPTKMSGAKEVQAAARMLRRIASYDERFAMEANDLLSEMLEEILWMGVISA